MTLDDLANKMDEGFKTLADKLDFVNLTVAKHTVSISGHDREIKELKDVQKTLESKFEERIAKIEKLAWISLGAGSAAGIGIAKLFM